MNFNYRDIIHAETGRFLESNGRIMTKAEDSLCSALQSHLKKFQKIINYKIQSGNNVKKFKEEIVYYIPRAEYKDLCQHLKNCKVGIIATEKGINGFGILLNPLVPHDKTAVAEIKAFIHSTPVESVTTRSALSDLIFTIRQQNFVHDFKMVTKELEDYNKSSAILEKNTVLSDLFTNIIPNKILTIAKTTEKLLKVLEFVEVMKKSISHVQKVTIDERILRWYNFPLGKLPEDLCLQYQLTSSKKIWAHIFHTPPLELFDNRYLGTEVPAKKSCENQYSFLSKITFQGKSVWGSTDLTFSKHFCYHACFTPKAPDVILRAKKYQEEFPSLIQKAFLTVDDPRGVKYEYFKV